LDEQDDLMQADVLVIGAGLAGLAAAARVVQEGGSAVVVEKGPAVGGSALYAGYIWTAPTYAVLRDVIPAGDPSLGRRLVGDFPAAVEWVRELGVAVGDPVTVLGYGVGHRTDLAGAIRACERIVEQDDESVVLRQATVARLLREDSTVVGAELMTSDGVRRLVRSGTTILATGGFAGSPEERAARLGPVAAGLPLRAHPRSVGDGLRLGGAVGAATAGRGAGFYGHLVPSGVPYDDPLRFTDLSFYHSEHSLLVNLEGRRFVDESIGDHVSTVALLEQPEARALLICDQRVHDQWMLGAPYVEGVEPVDRFALAYRSGARAAVAHDLEEFEALPGGWGYDGRAVCAAVRAFNATVGRGPIEPGRRADQSALVDPPYYVIEVVPAITFTYEGLRIDAAARVLGEDGRPVEGLLAAGADSGGVFARGYAGGIANALVFGLRAAQTALDAARAPA
jgi:succinate dehydrogenase/fumarate reductase flavoprotein subunit